MSNKNQLSLEFTHQPYMGKDDFITAPCNAEAFHAVDSWPDWPFLPCAFTVRKTAAKPISAASFPTAFRY